MEYLFLIFFSLSGFLMKLSDDAFDKESDRKLAVLLGMISGLLIGYLVVNSSDAAYIFLGILFGTGLAKKIDGSHHILSLATFLGLILIYGIPDLGILTLTICSLAAYLDEIGNDNIKLEKYRFWEFFFKYRFTLKVCIIILGMSTYLEILTGISIPHINSINPSTIFYFILFEISYEISGKSFNRVYETIYRFLDLLKVNKIILQLKQVT